MRLTPFLLFPAVALVAQAPAPANADLVQRFNTELPKINQLLTEFKSQEAMDRAQGLVPAQRPAFNGTSLQTIAMSLEDARGLVALYGLLANATVATGQWEKAAETQETRTQVARAILADLDKAQAPIAAQWKKVGQESGDFVAKIDPRKKELEAKVGAFKAEFETVSAEVKAGKRKLTQKELDDFNARGSQVHQDEQDLAALPVHKQNATNAPKVAKILGENRKELEGMIKTAEEAASKAKADVAAQNGEITDFNTQQVIKKVKIVGRKNWVDAVLRAHDNITKLGTPQNQAAFLNRLLVLDPGNANAQKALDNLKAGKEAFAKEAKPAKKSSAKKK